jgi:hypothetical protein
MAEQSSFQKAWEDIRFKGNTETWVDPLNSSCGRLGSAPVTWLFIGTLEFSKDIIDEDASFWAPF